MIVNGELYNLWGYNNAICKCYGKYITYMPARIYILSVVLREASHPAPDCGPPRRPDRRQGSEHKTPS
jgi:hypothetical protein